MQTTFKKILLVSGRDGLWSYGVLVLTMVLAAGLEAIGIGAILPLLGAISQPENLLVNDKVQKIFALLGHQPDMLTLMLVAGGGMVGATVVKNILSLVSIWLQARILFSMRAEIGRRLFQHYLSLPYASHLKRNLSALTHAVSGVVTNFTTVYMAAVLMIISELMVTACIVVLLVLVNPVLSLSAVGVAATFGGGYLFMVRGRSTHLGLEQHRLAVALNRCLIEGLSASKETRIFAAESYFLKRYDRLAKDYKRVSENTFVLGQAPRSAVESLFILGIVSLVVGLALLGRDLKEIIPTLALFGMAFLRILPSYNRILNSLTGVRVNQSALDILYSELYESPGQPLLSSLIAPDVRLGFNDSLRLRGVRYAYPDDSRQALDGIDFTLRKGQIVGLVGKSGSGKTTLVDLILGLLVPQSGDVLLDGKSILGIQNQWRQLLGYIPQTIYLTDDTLRRNIAFGIDDEDIDTQALDRAIAAAQLEELVRDLPDGLDTVVGDRGMRLSGGQRQRVGIARALYRDPPILVLDEATSALDIETETAVTDAIHALGRSKTMIVIAHRLTTVKGCDCICLLEAGKIVDCGTYAELAANNTWFRRINELLR